MCTKYGNSSKNLGFIIKSGLNGVCTVGKTIFFPGLTYDGNPALWKVWTLMAKLKTTDYWMLHQNGFKPIFMGNAI